MTRYSTSRGIMYSAPPGPDEDDEETTIEAETESVEPTAADD